MLLFRVQCYTLFDCGIALFVVCYVPDDHSESVESVVGIFKMLEETFVSMNSVAIFSILFSY